MIWRVLAVLGAMGWIAAYEATDRLKRERAELELAEARCAMTNILAERCDHALLTCQHWQARVTFELEAMATAIKERL